jgi:hypothetical protein
MKLPSRARRVLYNSTIVPVFENASKLLVVTVTYLNGMYHRVCANQGPGIRSLIICRPAVPAGVCKGVGINKKRNAQIIATHFPRPS